MTRIPKGRGPRDGSKWERAWIRWEQNNQVGEGDSHHQDSGQTMLSKAWNPGMELLPRPPESFFFHFIQGSLDNMTCMVVCFPGAPRSCEEAISKEMALDTALSHKVAGEQVTWPVGEVVGQCGLSAHLLLRAVCLCSGTSMPKHGFQDPGLRGHPWLASWRRATQQVSRGEVGGRMG